MRFSAPRSLSPSPVRGKPRKSYAFGLQSDSEEDSDAWDSLSYSGSESSSSSDSESDSILDSEDSEEYDLISSNRPPLRDPAERQYIEETVAAIRLRTRHHDPYEEWERNTRKESFRMARRELKTNRYNELDEKEKLRIAEAKRLDDIHAQGMAEVESKLKALNMQKQSAEEKLRQGLQLRDKKLWERIESVIKIEQEKVEKKLEEERKIKEAEEKKKREEELKRRLAEEKKKQEEEEKRKKEEEEKLRKEEEERKEKEEKQRAAEEEAAKKQRIEAEREQRAAIGLTTADDDWRRARENLFQLKQESTKIVRQHPQLKSEWLRLRRQITPKIGQLTNDPDEINRISHQLHDIICPPNAPTHSPPIYASLLSSLSKAILLQAETEVTAEKRAAIPLARVTFNLLCTVEHFPEIFFTKLVQRVGGWAIPIVIPSSADYDGTPWADEKARTKAMGYRKSQNGDELESPAEYTQRVAGIMRVYFHILKIPPVEKPLYDMLQLPRYWTWFARLMGERGLLETGVAPELIYTALDVMGADATAVWGAQWVKMLELVYEGVTSGIGNGKFIGGVSPEGKASRVRVELEVERIINGLKHDTVFS